MVCVAECSRHVRLQMLCYICVNQPVTTNLLGGRPNLFRPEFMYLAYDLLDLSLNVFVYIRMPRLLVCEYLTIQASGLVNLVNIFIKNV